MLAGPVFSRNDRRRREARCSLPRVAVESSSSAGSLVRNSLGDLFSATDSSEFCRPRCKAARRRSPAALDISALRILMSRGQDVLLRIACAAAVATLFSAGFEIVYNKSYPLLMAVRPDRFSMIISLFRKHQWRRWRWASGRNAVLELVLVVASLLISGD